MEAKPVELLFLPSPDDHQPPKKLKSTIPCTTPSGRKSNRDHQPGCTAPTHHGNDLALLRLLASNEPLGEQLAPKPLFLPRPFLPVMAGHRAVHASVFS
jgi:hypothetical protein